MIDREREAELDHEASRDRDRNQETGEEKIDAINQKKEKETTKTWLIVQIQMAKSLTITNTT